nr:MAG TPA: hypothetical protein [Caudoviricetes sp.]
MTDQVQFILLSAKSTSLPTGGVVILDRINTKRNYLESTDLSFLVTTRFSIQSSCAISSCPLLLRPLGFRTT